MILIDREKEDSPELNSGTIAFYYYSEPSSSCKDIGYIKESDGTFVELYTALVEFSNNHFEFSNLECYYDELAFNDETYFYLFV